MVAGLNGLSGAAASQTARKAEQDNAITHLLCLVGQIVKEMIMVNLQEHVMVLCLDTSDYIGCYGRNSNGVYSDKLYTSSYDTTMTNCYCIGYCTSKGYSLAGIYKYDLFRFF